MTRIAILAILVGTLLSAGRAFAQPTALLRGRVLDRLTREPVVGAAVVIGQEWLITDDGGAFAVQLPPADYTFDVVADWLLPARRVVHVPPEGAALEVLVERAPEGKGETIEIVTETSSAPGVDRVDAALARTLPGGGDAAKVVQSLPAVARPPAGSAEIVVWGAAPHDTRVFVDGVPVARLYHLGGYRAAVGNDLIGDIQLAPAAFGPERGRAIGGVIDLRLVDPDDLPSWRLQADLLDGTASGRAKHGRFSIAAAARQSWLDRVIGLAADPRSVAPNAPIPVWADAQLVARWKHDERTTLTSWVLGAQDALERRIPSDDPGTQTDEQIDQASVRAQVTLRRTRDTGFDAGTLWIGGDRDDYDLRVGAIAATRRRRTWVGGGRATQVSALGDDAVLTLGVDVDTESSRFAQTGSLTIPAREGDVHIFGQPPGDDVAADRWQASTVDAAVHGAIEARWRRFTATAGIRGDAWLLTASRLTPRIGATPGLGSQQILFDADPRGTLDVAITDEISARVDGGRYHQARSTSDTSAVFGSPKLGLEEAWHATVGTRWRRGPVSIEGVLYARWMSALVARDLAVTPPLARTLTQDGSGHVRGLQVSARLHAWHGFSGWLSYNLSRSRRKDGPTQAERFFDHDQTHGLIAVGGWGAGPWALGGRVRASTGEPRTAVTGAFYDGRSGRFQPTRGPQNGIRLPAYFAADLRAERRLAQGATRASVYLEVQNVTGRANAEELIYDADFSHRGYLTGVPFIALLGLRIER